MGKAKLADAEIITAMANGSGDNDKLSAMPITVGNTKIAAEVLVINKVRSEVNRNVQASKENDVKPLKF